MHIIYSTVAPGAARTINLDLRWLLLWLSCCWSLSLVPVLRGRRWVTAEPVAYDASYEALDQQARTGRRRAPGRAASARRICRTRGGFAGAPHPSRCPGSDLTELAELDAGEFDFSSVSVRAERRIRWGLRPMRRRLHERPGSAALRVDSREQQLEVLEQLLGERQLSEAEYLSAACRLRQGQHVPRPFGRRAHPLTGATPSTRR